MLYDVRPLSAVLAVCSVFAAGLISPAGARAEALPDANLSPLIATIGLPNALDGAALAPVGAMRFRTTVTAASHSAQDAERGETLLVDGETTQFAFVIDYGLTDKLQIGLQVPYLFHESGGLDHSIETWHDWFGLPNGIRDLVDQDQLNLQYRDGDVTLLNIDENQRGTGDISLTAAWQLKDESLRKSALRASLKLPTGDSNSLTGSGSADFSIGIAGDYKAIYGKPRWSSFYRAHLVFVGKPDRSSDNARPLISVLAGGISARLNSRLELTAQGTLRSAAYDSAIRMLGDPSLLLELGGTITLTERLRLAIAVGEDVYVESAPDVSFALTLHYSPSAN